MVLFAPISYSIPRRGSKIWTWARNQPPRMLQTQKHKQNRRLRDLNSMEDIPDQDSAKRNAKTSLPFILLARDIPGFPLG